MGLYTEMKMGKGSRLFREDVIEIIEKAQNADRVPDLRYAYLRGMDLRSLNLKGADLEEANLSGADLTNSNLEWADLRYANLKGADLRYVNLNEANLGEANLKDIVINSYITGNGREIKNLNLDYYKVVIAPNKVAIGCKRYTPKLWASFSDDGIRAMDKEDGERALKFWKKYKDIILDLAKPSTEE